MTPDLAELEALAKRYASALRLDANARKRRERISKERLVFYRSINPAIILSLIARVREGEGALLRARDETKALKAVQRGYSECRETGVPCSMRCDCLREARRNLSVVPPKSDAGG